MFKGGVGSVVGAKRWLEWTFDGQLHVDEGQLQVEGYIRVCCVIEGSGVTVGRQWGGLGSVWVEHVHIFVFCLAFYWSCCGLAVECRWFDYCTCKGLQQSFLQVIMTC